MKLKYKKINWCENPLLTVIIPVKNGEKNQTIESLKKQTFKEFDIIISYDINEEGANKTRNDGFRYFKVNTKYVLFSDDDIIWEKNALKTMIDILEKNEDYSICYGSYTMGGSIYCNQEFSRQALMHKNYMSTMSVIRTSCFPLFDESIKRLQDWDLWLTMINNGCNAIYCGKKIFSTEKRNGISYGGAVSYEQAYNVLKHKHNL